MSTVDANYRFIAAAQAAAVARRATSLLFQC
jgi:hypothetical protein